MQVGDLVQPEQVHGLAGQSYRTHGIVIKHCPESPAYKEHVIVRWNDGDIEMEVPEWLEIISESR